MDSLKEYEFYPITENPIILDFSECGTIWDIHELLKEKFGFHDHYGRNWDALWDCMRDVFEDEAYCVELCGFSLMAEELKEECGVLFEIFDRIATINPEFTYKII